MAARCAPLRECHSRTTRAVFSGAGALNAFFSRMIPISGLGCLLISRNFGRKGSWHEE
jgi:hypothetical protein